MKKLIILASLCLLLGVCLQDAESRRIEAARSWTEDGSKSQWRKRGASTVEHLLKPTDDENGR